MKADLSKIPTAELKRMMAGAQHDLKMLSSVAQGIAAYAGDLSAEIVKRSDATADAATMPPAAA